MDKEVDKEERTPNSVGRGVAWRGCHGFMVCACGGMVGWDGVCSGTHTASICTYNTIDTFCTHMFLDVHV